MYERPDWVRRLNALGQATGESTVSLDPDELLAIARETTGLTDVGDELDIESMRQRVRSIDAESNATHIGRILARNEIVRVLQTRLRLRKVWAEHPEIFDEKITAPIFVIGPPRTGTTITLELLALDPSLRAPVSWEASHPLPLRPIVDPATDGGADREAEEAERMAMGEAEHELWADIQPELMTVHELRHDLPCECVHFMALNFSAGYWSMQYNSPLFGLWVQDHPELVAREYADHRKFLQTLQWQDRQLGRNTTNWLLKTPGHLMAIPELFAEYPDALIVSTHRDPLKWVASAASTTAILRWIRSNDVDPLVQGQTMSIGFRFMVEQLMGWRTDGTVPEDRFVDSHFDQLMTSPADAIRQVYDRIGLAWPEGHAEAIENYLAEKPKGKFGKHEYTFEQYGLDADQLRAEYATYVAHYNITEE